MKYSHIYRIAPHYRSVTIWTCDAATRQLIGTSICKPFPNQDRKQRHATICRRLRDERIPVPAYAP